jgi:hypothetical protein
MADAAEKKEPEIIETKRITDIATVDVRDASAQGLALMEERVRNQKKMLAIAINLTAPNQWTVFAGTDKSGVHRESIYPTGGAADTILRRAFGLSWGEKEITIEDTPDGKLATCTAWLMQGKEPIEKFTGYRFLGGYIKNDADLSKGAIENMKTVAVRDLLGLRFRTPGELKEMGLDVNKLERRAEFQSHDKDPNAMTVPFGRDKGKALTDVDDKCIDWLAEATKKSIADPAKAKFKSKNEALLQALRDEYIRRHSPAPADPAKGKKAKEKGEPTAAAPSDADAYDYGPPPMSDDELAGMHDGMDEPGAKG